MAINFKRVAELLRKSANGHRARDLRTWSDPDDGDMRKMVRGDHKDALRIALWIEKGKPEKAIDIMFDLDTSARDQVASDLEKNSKRFYKKYIEDYGAR